MNLLRWFYRTNNNSNYAWTFTWSTGSVFLCNYNCLDSCGRTCKSLCNCLHGHKCKHLREVLDEKSENLKIFFIFRLVAFYPRILLDWYFITMVDGMSYFMVGLYWVQLLSSVLYVWLQSSKPLSWFCITHRKFILGSFLLRSSGKASVCQWQRKRIFKIKNIRVFGNWTEKSTTDTMDFDSNKRPSIDSSIFACKLKSVVINGVLFAFNKKSFILLAEHVYNKQLHFEQQSIEIFEWCALHSNSEEFDLYDHSTYCHHICIDLYWFYERFSASTYQPWPDKYAQNICIFM